MDEREKIEQRIRDLSCDLAAGDYKIIKCYEYSLVGIDFPYNIAELNAERQAIRDEINELKEQLENMLFDGADGDISEVIAEQE